jgi:hypothetical protein
MTELIQIPPNPFFLWLASIFNLITAVIHFFVGGKFVAKPLLNSSLKTVAKYTNYYCWHMVSIILVAMSLAFALAALYPSAWDLGAAALLLAISFLLWSVALWTWKNINPLKLPQWILFMFISVAGLLAFLLK